MVKSLFVVAEVFFSVVAMAVVVVLEVVASGR